MKNTNWRPFVFDFSTLWAHTFFMVEHWVAHKYNKHKNKLNWSQTRNCSVFLQYHDQLWNTKGSSYGSTPAKCAALSCVLFSIVAAPWGVNVCPFNGTKYEQDNISIPVEKSIHQAVASRRGRHRGERERGRTLSYIIFHSGMRVFSANFKGYCRDSYNLRVKGTILVII